MTMKIRCAAMLLGLVAGEAEAQTTVYRCGPDGRSYSEKPCAGGRAVDVSDSRSPEQREAAEIAALREAEAARELAQDNRERERNQRPLGAASLSGTPKQEERQPARVQERHRPKAHKPKTSKPGRPQDFIAVPPGSEPGKKKPRRDAPA